MIELELTEVHGFDAAIRGMRNPFNSWLQSDSRFSECWDVTTSDDFMRKCKKFPTVIGTNDLALMKKLVKAGSDHSKFMRMINVTVDITAPRFWWTENDTYKVGTVRNSCSTMHTIMNREFTVDDFSLETIHALGSDDLVECILGVLNHIRDVYARYEEHEEADDLLPGVTKEQVWRSLIEILPQSYNQRATVQLNYAVLRNIYHARKNHKLDEWREFCKWVETLPYSELITEV